MVGSGEPERRLQIIVIIRHSDFVCLLQLLVVLIHLVLINLHFSGSKGRLLDERQVGITSQLAEDVKEWLLKVVVALGRDIIVLEVLAAVEHDVLGFHLAVLAVNFVAAEHDGNVLADAHQVLVPDGHVLICDTGSNIEHDDGSVTANVIAITKSTELLLTSGVPAVEDYGAQVGVKGEGMHFNTHGSNIFLLKLSGSVAFDESGFADTTITNQNEFELRNLLVLHVD